MKKILLFLTVLMLLILLFVSCEEPNTSNENNETSATTTMQCEHKYVSKVTTAVTCTTDGVKTFTCSVCNDSYVEAIAAQGHLWASATCTTPQTCSKCNKTQGTVLEHSWRAATCATPQTCSKCNKTQGTVLEHSWRAATCATPQTCSKCNKTQGVALGHSWKPATCTTPQTCSKCNKTQGAASGHSWTPATCQSPRKCGICQTTTGKIDPNAHSGIRTCDLCNFDFLEILADYVMLYGTSEKSVVDNTYYWFLEENIYIASIDKVYVLHIEYSPSKNMVSCSIKNLAETLFFTLRLSDSPESTNFAYFDLTAGDHASGNISISTVDKNTTKLPLETVTSSSGVSQDFLSKKSAEHLKLLLFALDDFLEEGSVGIDIGNLGFVNYKI